MMDGRIYKDILQSDVAKSVALVFAVLLLIAALMLLSGLFGAVREIIRYGPRAYLRRATDLDPGTMRLIAVLICVVVAALLIAFPLGVWSW